MHLGLPSGLSFTDVADDNPTWLNRVIAMKKEYDLGSAFQAAHPNPPAQCVAVDETPDDVCSVRAVVGVAVGQRRRLGRPLCVPRL
jgi:hypothetical protein